jgi:predicted lipoprotein with Yx(FWY)xxD motif
MSAFGIGKLGLGSSSSVVPAASGSAGSLQTKSTSIGTVLVDSSGHTVYELVGASAANNMCSGGCLSMWPEVTANGSQVVVRGASRVHLQRRQCSTVTWATGINSASSPPGYQLNLALAVLALAAALTGAGRFIEGRNAGRGHATSDREACCAFGWPATGRGIG